LFTILTVVFTEEITIPAAGAQQAAPPPPAQQDQTQAQRVTPIQAAPPAASTAAPPPARMRPGETVDTLKQANEIRTKASDAAKMLPDETFQ